ncbi:MAG TPA: hypothetical protein VJ697_10705 [Nitrososphaeraceae archaeon]|nr:hypothetical protein [Nitrososphaeraceae archaeon]
MPCYDNLFGEVYQILLIFQIVNLVLSWRYFLLTYLVIFSLNIGKSISDNAFANVAAEIEEANALLPPFYLEVLKIRFLLHF